MALIVSCVAGTLGQPGAWFLMPDVLFPASLFTIGLHAVQETVRLTEPI